MAWFRRDKTVNEARDYLRATDAVSRPMAALLSLVTIIILVVVFFLFFLLLRWGYNAIFGDDTVNEPVVVAPAPDASTDFGGSSNDGQLNFPGFVSEDEANRITNSNGGVQSGAAPRSNQSTGAPTQTPSVGPTLPTTIPDTGPGSSE